MRELKTGDRVIISKIPTICNNVDSYIDRKKGDITILQNIYNDGTTGIESSKFIIDLKCLSLYKEKITNWKKEMGE